MFPAMKAQFDLAMAWSEFAASTLAASTMMAGASAKVLAAGSAVERLGREQSRISSQDAGAGGMFVPWLALTMPTPRAPVLDPMRLAEATSQATIAFWSTLLSPSAALWQPTPPQPLSQPLWWMTAFGFPPPPPPKPQVKPLPLWWTAFTEPLTPAKPANDRAPALIPKSPYLH